LINICIHGHFYQPPRENPWTGEIPKQNSAKPYHDWDEKIYHECYKPNSIAPIIDDKGTVLKEVNNYSLINFDFGPSLLGWMKNKHPETYLKIIEADKQSVIAHNGHGNAIALAYNHLIMPLANERDKYTQVRWAVKDFRYHFGRDAESIWLPETACNMATVEVLINEGIRYIILDVSQAEKVRPLNDENWIDVSNSTIDPKISYRCFSETNSQKYIEIFFYDGPISKAVAFDNVLVSSNELLHKIYLAIPPGTDAHGLISVAADGETFGHHKKLAERTLAYFLAGLAPQNNLQIVNYGEYLENNPPENEVKLKAGKNGEGTSWSCPHGVDRWKDDCGCGSGDGRHQRWRKPLRESLDWLRDQLVTIYENIGNRYFKDVWKAREEYIDLILDNSGQTAIKYFSDNAARILSEEELQTCYKLLEMQRFSMFMFTSCGWFFSEISGLEAVQILQYAARAIELAEEISGISLEKEFVEKLSLAESNLKKYKNGKVVYNRLVKPRRKK